MTGTSSELNGLDALLRSGSNLEKVTTGCIWSEGPAWIAGSQSLRWSDIPNNRIMQFDATTGETSVYRSEVGYTNGRIVAADGAVIQCSHLHRAIERDYRGETTVLVDSLGGARLNSPNDVVVKSDGTVWFTDPPYGITVAGEGLPGEREYHDNFVFRLDPIDHSLSVVVSDIEEPNGLAFSPDESILYVSDTSIARRSDGTGNGHIRAYDVRDGRTCKNGRTFASVSSGIPDGFRVDDRGNLWSSSADGVAVFDLDGSFLGLVAVPEMVGNVCFGGASGSDLYITATTSVYRICTRVRDGSSWWRDGKR